MHRSLLLRCYKILFQFFLEQKKSSYYFQCSWLTVPQFDTIYFNAVLTYIRSVRDHIKVIYLPSIMIVYTIVNVKQ